MPTRSRSRSPLAGSHRRPHRERSKSPANRRSKHHDSKHRGQPKPPVATPAALPPHVTPLSKRDFEKFKNVFALYLDIQKELNIEDLEEREVQGRWRSFVKKWNHAELAIGWYDPKTFDKANASNSSEPPVRERPPTSRHRGNVTTDHSEESEEDAIGPVLPGQDYFNDRKSGPGMPNREDLVFRDEMIAQESGNRHSHLHEARKAYRKEEKQHLEELAPRAEPGSRERQLEKKREAAAAARAFREKSPEVEDAQDLMGDDSIENYKARKKVDEKKKNEREVRKEELLRARAAEREEKVAELRAKEDKTMDMLKALAKQRFG